ncbi:MAG: dephospho-CoA kinase [Clostridia bacterium]|nr:dephospho-CoA kinase [Clostridia bacterium]
MIVLGITGNIGSGKSLAAAYLQELGAAVIDADQVGHLVIRSDGPAYAPLLAVFGKGFLDADGEFDRRRLGEFVFGDASGEARLRLNAVTHPLIREEILERLALLSRLGYPVAVVEAAVLLESELVTLLDKIWLISAPRDMMVKRVIERDSFSRDAAEQRLRSQMAEVEMRQKADLVIVNAGSPDQFKQKLLQEYNKLLKESA